MFKLSLNSELVVAALATAAALLVSFSAVAASPIKVGTGSVKGNYYKMAMDINNYCGGEIERGLDILPSGGSIINLNGMTNKEYAMGIVQEDVLQYYAKQNPTRVNHNSMKVVMGMHREPVHILIPKGYEPSGGSWRDSLVSFVSGKENKGLSLDLLKNQVVGSWGGSLVSAKALSSFADLNLNVVEIPEEARGRAGKHPILLVGGQPYEPVIDYLKTGKYDLMPIDAGAISAKAPFYSAVTLNYAVAGKILSTPSFGVRALLIGKSFRNESRNADMSKLATCMTNNLVDLADDSDTNPNWASVVDLENGAQTNWAYFPVK